MKIKYCFVIVVSLIVISLAACSAGGEHAGAGEPQSTAIVNVPEQVESKSSEQDEPVKAPAVSKSKGQFVVEAMIENLDDYVLRKEDMPNDYKIVEDGEQHLTNLKVINAMGEVSGKRSLAATTRKDGWSLELQRVNKEELIPYTIFSQVEVFETVEGAQAAFSPDWFHAYIEQDKDTNWIEKGCDIGDACVMYFYEKLEPTTDLTTLQYEVAYVYKNVLAQVMGRGLDFDMNPDYVVVAAETLFEKIDNAQMAD